MLGITVSDAVVIGSLVASFLTIAMGIRNGAMAAKNKDPGPVLSLGGGAFVDTLGLHDNTAALNRVADAIERGCDLVENRSDARMIELLEKIAARTGN